VHTVRQRRGRITAFWASLLVKLVELEAKAKLQGMTNERIMATLRRRGENSLYNCVKKKTPNT